MPSCKVGHVYIVTTSLTKPPKEKYALCVSDEHGFFVWFNSLQRDHADDQMGVAAGCHELIVHDSFLDLSRVVMHDGAEIENGKEFACISPGLCEQIVAYVKAGLEVMPPRHSAIILQKLQQIYGLAGEAG